MWAHKRASIYIDQQDFWNKSLMLTKADQKYSKKQQYWQIVLQF